MPQPRSEGKAAAHTVRRNPQVPSDPLEPLHGGSAPGSTDRGVSHSGISLGCRARGEAARGVDAEAGQSQPMLDSQDAGELDGLPVDNGTAFSAGDRYPVRNPLALAGSMVRRKDDMGSYAPVGADGT